MNQLDKIMMKAWKTDKVTIIPWYLFHVFIVSRFHYDNMGEKVV